MELEKVTAEIRPRSDWEAVDLGVSLARLHLGTLWRAWLVTVLPMSILILAVFFKSLGWGIFLIWWLKPIWDRVALFPLSRNLFGEEPDIRATIRVLPQQLKENWLLVLMGVIFAGLGPFIHGEDVNKGLTAIYWLTLLGLLFYRSSIYRSFVLPVRFLEGLKGAQYSGRVSLLSCRSSGAAFGLTITGLLMEYGLFYSQFFFLQLMVPEGTEYSFFGVLADFFETDSDAFPQWLMVVIAVAYWAAMTLTSWFYAGGGFGLYVNSRTWSEGWDIELAFKRLGQRIAVVILALGFFSITPELQAQTSNDRVEEVLAGEDFEVGTRIERQRKMEEVMESDDFDVQTRAEREREEELSFDDGGSMAAGIFGQLGVVLFWIMVVAAVGGIIWVIVHNLQAFGGGGSTDAGPDKKIKTLAGMQIAPESLPDDVLTAARKLWATGEKKAALGLLYRAAISSLVSRDLVEIEESDTESDCLRRLGGKKLAELAYFSALTNAWMSAAYAKVTPDEATMDQLCAEWPFKGRRKL